MGTDRTTTFRQVWNKGNPASGSTILALNLHLYEILLSFVLGRSFFYMWCYWLGWSSSECTIIFTLILLFESSPTRHDVDVSAVTSNQVATLSPLGHMKSIFLWTMQIAAVTQWAAFQHNSNIAYVTIDEEQPVESQLRHVQPQLRH